MKFFYKNNRRVVHIRIHRESLQNRKNLQTEMIIYTPVDTFYIILDADLQLETSRLKKIYTKLILKVDVQRENIKILR